MLFFCPLVSCSCHNRLLFRSWSVLPEQRLKTDWTPFPGWAEDSAKGDAVHAAPAKVVYRGMGAYLCTCAHTHTHTKRHRGGPIVNATQICRYTWTHGFGFNVRWQSNTCTNTHANEAVEASWHVAAAQLACPHAVPDQARALPRPGKHGHWFKITLTRKRDFMNADHWSVPLHSY